MDYHGYGGLRVGWKIYLQTLRKAAPFDVVHRKPIRRVSHSFPCNYT
jgi:hypothetical protein